MSAAEDRKYAEATLAKLVVTIPESFSDMSVQRVRQWVDHIEKAKKLLASNRASLVALTSACSQLQSF